MLRRNYEIMKENSHDRNDEKRRKIFSSRVARF